VTPPALRGIRPLSNSEKETPRLSATVLRILDHIRNIQRGGATAVVPWHQFDLQENEYAELTAVVAKDDTLQAFWNDKLKYVFSCVFAITDLAPQI